MPVYVYVQCMWTECIVCAHCCQTFHEVNNCYFFYEKVLVSFSKFVIVLINWEQDFVLFNSVCKHTRDKIRLLLRGRPILLITYMITDWTGLHSLYFRTLLRTRDKIHTLLYKNLSGKYHNASFCVVSLITYHSLPSLTSCTYKLLTI